MKVQIRRNMETLMEPSNPYEHQSNGAAEVINHQIERQVTVMLASLEQRLGRKIDRSSRFMLWIPEYAGRVRSRCKLHNDRTPHEIIHGKQSRIMLGNIGERILFQDLENPNKRRKLEIKFREGIYLGIHPGGMKHLVYDCESKIARTTHHIKSWDF